MGRGWRCACPKRGRARQTKSNHLAGLCRQTGHRRWCWQKWHLRRSPAHFGIRNQTPLCRYARGWSSAATAAAAPNSPCCLPASRPHGLHKMPPQPCAPHVYRRPPTHPTAPYHQASRQPLENGGCAKTHFPTRGSARCRSAKSCLHKAHRIFHRLRPKAAPPCSPSPSVSRAASAFPRFHRFRCRRDRPYPVGVRRAWYRAASCRCRRL